MYRMYSAAKRRDARKRPAGAFDAADIAAVQAREFGQDFLRPAAGGKKSTHRDVGR